jgi:hypothetical protein
MPGSREGAELARIPWLRPRRGCQRIRVATLHSPPRDVIVGREDRAATLGQHPTIPDDHGNLIALLVDAQTPS